MTADPAYVLLPIIVTHKWPIPHAHTIMSSGEVIRTHYARAERLAFAKALHTATTKTVVWNRRDDGRWQYQTIQDFARRGRTPA